MASNKSTSSDSDEEYCDAEEPSSFADIKATSLSKSLTISSDEVQEMFCEECEKHDNIYVPAEGFCVECVEYKCAICIKFHRRHHQNHSLQDKDKMPKDFYFEKCTKHPKELIKFYCGKCEKVACPECKRNDHRNCCNVEHLPKLVKNVEHSQELKDIKENIDKVSKDIETIKTQIKSKTEIAFNLKSKAKATIKERKDKLISAYRQHHKEIITKFDKKMEETIAKLKSERKKLTDLINQKQTKFEQNLMHSENDTVQKVEGSQTNLESLKTKNTTLTSDLKQLSADITQAEVSGQKCKLFLAMKDAHGILKSFEKQLLNLQGTNIQYYIIEPLNTEVSVKAVISQTTFFSYKDYNSTTGKIATFDKVINSVSGRFSCLCLLSENILIQTDSNTNCLNILKNIQTSTESYDSIKMLSRPWGITKVEDNKVAVTFPNKGIVKLIIFSDSMTVISTDDITVGAECWGIAYSNNNLIVSYTKPGKVQILDMSGNVLKCFDKDSNGQPLFSAPHYLTLSPDRTTIYVSDWGHTVTSMTLDGKVKAIYRNEQLSTPCQMTVDESGTVYVCGIVSHNVHQLSSDLIKVKIMLDERQGIKCPVSVAYCQKSSKLYVGMPYSNIKVFILSLK